MKPIEGQINLVRTELSELESALPGWENDARSKVGAARYKNIAKRIVESARRLEALVKENTFPSR